jgi:hypothetical protein
MDDEGYCSAGFINHKQPLRKGGTFFDLGAVEKARDERLAALAEKSCQCAWHSCGASHSLGDSCHEPAVGIYTNPNSKKKYALCQDCHDHDEDGPVPDDQWTPFEVAK